MSDFDKTIVNPDSRTIVEGGGEVAVNVRIPEIELGTVIGRGGTGVVFKGRQPYLKRDVAVKVLNPGAESDFNIRFQREAQILAGLVHPNIVSCYQAGLTEDQQPYIAMEFIDGPTLGGFIEDQGALSQSLALDILLHICHALEYAYAKKIIHRDIKAENILLKPDDSGLSGEFRFIPKLADLGIARSTEMTMEENITAVGVVVGTPNSMAPEQFNSPEQVDFPADIYGLGCVLYQMLTAKKPFSGSRLIDIITRKMDRDYPDPKVHNPRIDKSVVRLLRSMLAPEIADRPRSYQDLIKHLQGLLENREQRLGKKTPAARYGLSISVLLVAAGAAYWYASGLQDGEQPVAQETIAPEAPVASGVADEQEATDTEALSRQLSDREIPVSFDNPPRTLISEDFARPLENWRQTGGEASWVAEDEAVGVNGIGTGQQAYAGLANTWRLTGSMALLTPDSKEAGITLFAADGEQVIFSLKQLGKRYLSIAVAGPGGKPRSLAFEPLDIDLADQQPFALTFVQGRLQFRLGDRFIGSLPMRAEITELALFVDQSTASFRDLLLFAKP